MLLLSVCRRRRRAQVIAGEHFKPWLGDLQTIFMGSMQDAEMRVRVAGLRAACQVLGW
jgi:hypothetical protein